MAQKIKAVLGEAEKLNTMAKQSARKKKKMLLEVATYSFMSLRLLKDPNISLANISLLPPKV